MKKFYIILIVAFFANIALAQKFDFNLNEINSVSVNPDMISTCVPLNWNDIDNSQSKIDNDNPSILGNPDSLNDYVKRSSGFKIYGINYQGTTYFLTGMNPFYFWLGQKFNISGTAKVTEILFAAGLKIQRGATKDSIFGLVYSGEPTSGLPTNPLGVGGIKFDDIDTNYQYPVFSSIKFTNPPVVDTKFVTMLVTNNNASNEYDAIVILSNNQGDGLNENNACIVFNNNGNLSSTNFSSYFNSLQMPDGNPPNFDIMIFPIIETGPDGVGDGPSMNGITVQRVSPNPAMDKVGIYLSLEHSARVSVDLVNMNGIIVSSIPAKDYNEGEHSFQFDLQNIPSGSYYYLINANSTKFGGKLNVVK